jgi:hypothetical protein
MTEKKEQIGEEIPENDKRWEKVERMFDEIRPGYKMSVHRMRPPWCSGYLERLEITEDAPVDMDYLIDQWGGEVLRLRLSDETGTYRKGADVNLKNFPPKFEGREIKRGPDGTRVFVDDWKKEQASQRQQQQQIVPVQAQQRPQITEFAELLRIFQQSSQDNPLIQMVLEGVLKQRTVQQNNPVGQFSEMMKQFREMQDLFGSGLAGAEPQQSDENAMLGTISQIASALLNRQQAPVQAQQQMIAPRPQPVQAQHQQQQAFQGETEVEPQAPKGDLADHLAAMDVNESTTLILTSLQRMDENKRAQAFETIMEQTGIASLMGAGGFQGMPGEDGEFDDEPDEPDGEPRKPS